MANLIKKCAVQLSVMELTKASQCLAEFRNYRKEMLRENRVHGWCRKKSYSRDKSIDTAISKKVIIEEEPPKRMVTRRTMKVLNKFKSGFDLIKV